MMKHLKTAGTLLAAAWLAACGSSSPDLGGGHFHGPGDAGCESAVPGRLGERGRAGGQYRGLGFGRAIAAGHGRSGMRGGRLLPQVLDPGRRRRDHRIVRGHDGAHRRHRLLRAAPHRAVCARHEHQQGLEYRQHHRPDEHRGRADCGHVRRAGLHRRRAELCGLRHLDARLPSLPECGPAIRRDDEHLERRTHRAAEYAQQRDQRQRTALHHRILGGRPCRDGDAACDGSRRRQGDGGSADVGTLCLGSLRRRHHVRGRRLGIDRIYALPDHELSEGLRQHLFDAVGRLFGDLCHGHRDAAAEHDARGYALRRELAARDRVVRQCHAPVSAFPGKPCCRPS